MILRDSIAWSISFFLNKSLPNLKAMKNLSKIGEGKVYGYEAGRIPSWEDAFTEWDKNGHIY